MRLAHLLPERSRKFGRVHWVGGNNLGRFAMDDALRELRIPEGIPEEKALRERRKFLKKAGKVVTRGLRTALKRRK